MQYFVYFAILAVSTILSVALAPKPPRPKPASLEDFDLPTAEQNRSIPVVFGEIDITGPNVVWYGKLRVEEVRKKKGGIFGIGKKKVTVGFRYFMGLHFVLCYGPVDEITRIRVGDKLALEPVASDTTEVLIDQPNLFGGDEKEGGVKGYADVLMGKPDQTSGTDFVPSYLRIQHGANTPGYRGVVSFVWKGGTLGASPYPKPWAFGVKRLYKGWHNDTPWYPSALPVPLDDSETRFGMNPAHIIYQCITDPQWGMGYPAAKVDDESFELAADTLIGERLGLCLLWNQQDTIQGFVQVVMDHMGGVLYADPETGKFKLKLIRAASQSGVDDGGFNLLGSYTSWGYSITPDAENPDDPALEEYAPPAYTGATRLPASSDGDGVLDWPVVSVLWVRANVSLPPAPKTIISFAAENGGHLYLDGVYFGSNNPLNNQPNPNGYGFVDFDVTATVAGKRSVRVEIKAYDEGIVSGSTYLSVRGKQTAADGGAYSPRELDLDESNCTLKSWQRVGYGETTNEITVVYRDLLTGKDTPITVQDLANIQAQGAVVSETKQYPGVATATLAGRLAQRDLIASSTPIAKGTLEVLRDGWRLVPGDLVTVSWAKLGLVSVLCRVLSINRGTLTDGALDIEVSEDVYGLGQSVYGAQDGNGFTPPTTDPQPITLQAVLEATYWHLAQESGAGEVALLPATGAVAQTLAAEPSNASQGYTLYGRVSPADYDENDEGVYTPTALLTNAVSRSATTATITVGTATRLDQVTAGTLAWLPGTTARLDEWVRVDSIDTDTGALTLTRGLLDTVPQAHAPGLRLWFADGTLATDDLRSAGNVANIKLTDRTYSGESPIADATALSITLDARQNRPWVPGNFEINGNAAPTLITAPLELTWAHRDRKLQTSLLTVQSDATDIGPEAGVTYTGYLYDDNSDALLETQTGIAVTTWLPALAGAYRVRAELEAVRDGRESWQRQVRVFDFDSANALRLTEAGEPRQTERGESRITE